MSSVAKITYLKQLEPAIECILLLSRQYSLVQAVPAGVDQILVSMQESYGIPVEALSERLMPVRILESHILDRLQVQQEELTFYFGDGTPYMGGLAWAFYFLERERVCLQELEGDTLLRELRRLICLALDDTPEGLDQVRDLSDFLEFLDNTSCSLHLKWCCSKVWSAPGRYQRRFREILDQAEALFQEAMALDGIRVESEKHIEDLFQGHPENALESASAAQDRDQVYVRPSLVAFNGAIRLWDPTRPEAPVYLFVGVLQQAIADLVKRYGNNSENLLSTLKSISDKRRFEILQALKEGPWYGFELAKRLSISPCVVSHHMNYLLNDRLVRVEKQGTKISYSLNEGEIQRFVQNLSDALT